MLVANMIGWNFKYLIIEWRRIKERFYGMGNSQGIFIIISELVTRHFLLISFKIFEFSNLKIIFEFKYELITRIPYFIYNFRVTTQVH